MASKKNEGIARKGKLLACGFIPGADFVLQRANKKPHSKVDDSKFAEEERGKIVAVLQRVEECKHQFLQYYPDWERERLDCIEKIVKLAENIELHHRNINIAQLPTAGVGIVGAVLTITGLALIPVTFGASLGLSITGAVMGIGSAVSGATSAVVDIGIRVDRVRDAKKLVEQHKESTERLFGTAEELVKLCDEVNKQPSLKDAVMECAGGSMYATARNGKTYVQVGVAVAKTLPRAIKSAHLLRKGFGLSAAAGASSLKTVEIVSDAGVTTTKLVATTAGRVLTGLGYGLCAIGIVVDLISAGVAVYDLSKGSKTSASDQLKEQAENLRKEMKFLKQVYDELNN